ncbi:Aminopeptidase [Sergentomyia squamirostris]
MVHNPAILVRPSSVSNFSRQDSHTLRKSHTLVLSLATICVVLTVLLCIVVVGLVLVGKNLSRISYTSALTARNFSESDQLSEQDLISASLANRSTFTLQKSGNSQQSPGTNNQHGAMTSTRLSAAAAKIVEQLSFRLPAEIRPKRYNLHLHPNLVEKTFSGNVSIDLEVSKPVSFIAVHTKKLTISATSLEKNDLMDVVPLAETFEYEPLEYWITVPKDTIQEGVYQLNMTFNGSLINRIVGFYASSYFNPLQNETRTIATSKFEPTYARQAFPCFDEPAMKAPFKISIVRPTGNNYISLSNMNEEQSDETGVETISHFAESVPMSTYLACFIVCDFLHKAETIKTQGIGQDFQLRVFATPNQINKTEFALNTGVGITEFYIQYFGIEYPLPKLDMIAIPDFVSGAMETWGLVTYRETALLYDPEISSAANKQRVATVIAHELSHMWFGNLVTMKFWNDLWLNEGFASYIEYKGCDHLFPSWGMMDQFLIEDIHYVFRIDASLATHPIVQTVENPDQITEMFDAISYNKGAAIIRMLEDIIGSENFRKSITKYLNAHKYGNADTNDLLTQIEKLNLDYDIKFVMDTWTRQGGFPVVTVEKVDEKTYKLTQKRFFSNPENDVSTAPSSEYNYRWYIPITYYTNTDATVHRKWFPNSDTETEIIINEPHDWIKFNKDQIGFYYVNYPETMWKSLSSALLADMTVLSVSDRSQLLNDVFYLADSTAISYEVALNLTQYLKNEDQYVPWVVAASRLQNVYNLMYQTDLVPLIEKYVLQLVEKAYQSIGWSAGGDDHLKNRLRGRILDLACSMGHQDCLKIAGQEFNKWLENPSNRPHPDLRSVTYEHGMVAVGDKDKWEQVWNIYLAETDAQEKSKLMNALTAIKDHSVLSRFINLCWDENNVRGQDHFMAMISIAGNPIGQTLVWDYVRENWEKYVERFGLNERYLGRMIPAITKRFNSNIKLDEMKAFFAKYPEAGAGTAARKEALENVSGNIKWLQNNKQVVSDWFVKNVK